MSDSKEPMPYRLNKRTIILAFVVCCIVAGAGARFLHTVHESTSALRLSWTDHGLKVYSAKDGPFVLTHLFQPWSGSRESSVAQLPEPVTIIDSRGHYFTHAEIQALAWIGASGCTNSPPSAGTDLKAFYLVPRATDPTSEHDIFMKKELRYRDRPSPSRGRPSHPTGRTDRVSGESAASD